MSESSLINRRQYSALYKILAVIVAAFGTGFMWRARGSHGFGGMFGMFSVAAFMTLLILAIFGDRKKNIYEMIPLMVFATGVTAGGWGTLNRQMAGVLDTTSVYSTLGESTYVSISPFSGMLIMLMLGFGWLPFFGFLLGRFFTDKRYKVKHLIIAALVFYSVQYILKATLAHPILELFHPQAAELFAKGLAEQGLDTNQWLMYLKHFNGMSWAKKITGGRNYFTSIEVVSKAIAAAAVMLYQRFGVKDKRGSVINFCTCAIMAVSITLADVIMLFDVPGGIFEHIKKPQWLKYTWSYWEYFTGFLLGLGVMILCFIADKKLKDNWNLADDFPTISRKLRAAYNTLTTLFFTFGLALAMPAISRVYDQEYTLTGKKVFYSLEDYNAAIQTNPDLRAVCFKNPIPIAVTYVVVLAALLAVYAYIVHKNMIKKGLDTPIDMSPVRFAGRAYITYFLIVAALYFFTNGAALLNPVKDSVTKTMLVSFAVVILGIIGLKLSDRQVKSKA
ncbi:MAG TPA: hypothetical protein PLK57_02695 [Clostridiales bacterium]|nr:hypothetical protein [Clostridiales bacterium]HXK83288.1 hypothetical protein [Clostridiales bacterium]